MELITQIRDEFWALDNYVYGIIKSGVPVIALLIENSAEHCLVWQVS